MAGLQDGYPAANLPAFKFMKDKSVIDSYWMSDRALSDSCPVREGNYEAKY